MSRVTGSLTTKDFEKAETFLAKMIPKQEFSSDINNLKSKESVQPNNLTKPNLLVTNTKHDVKHYISTKDPPVYSKARQLDSKKLEIAKQEFKFMLDNDIIRPSKSP
ncbi:transposon Tf2-6 polyprotein [Trichonephila clavipes]|nr:transposon Tf2-6 polyprotein [Trichonephila clavipes]